jgi:two-component system phosphate regulon response regulator PhoB
MSGENILVVEDEEDILELVSYNLLKEGFQVAGANSGERALEAVKNRTPDLMILDLMLPGVDGLEVCRIMKKNPGTESIPIIMLTAKSEEGDIVKGLEYGADDYVTKPFSPKVLIARVKAVLRRLTADISYDHLDRSRVIEIHNMIIRPERHEVLVDGKQVELTFTEFRILHYLASRPGWVFSRQQILDAVRGDEYPVTDRSVDVQIVGLRKKLGEAGKYIETVRGIGYKLKE